MSIQEKLTITVVSGRGLYDKGGIFGRNDAYAVIYVGNKLRQTGIIEDAGHQAYWDESFVFEINPSDEIRVDCIHGDGSDEGDLIGRVRIPLNNIRKYQNIQNWYQLGKKGDFRGEILLRINYENMNQFQPNNVHNPFVPVNKEVENPITPVNSLPDLLDLPGAFINKFLQ